MPKIRLHTGTKKEKLWEGLLPLLLQAPDLGSACGQPDSSRRHVLFLCLHEPYLKHKILQTEDTNDGRLMAKACETKHQHRAAHAVTQFFPDGMVFFCVCVPNWSHLNQPRLKHETLRTANWWRQLVKASTGILRHLKRLKIIHVIHKSIHMIS